MIKHLSLKAYGKINLGLDVLGKRDDGYHEVRMIMQTIGIFDRIDLIRKEEPGIQIETNLFYLPTNENNLVYKAARMLMDEFSIPGGIFIRLRKFIPVSAGLAGGSSDAAAVLFGINKMFRLELTASQLMERGVKIGADVPYCILRGTALSEGIGEVLTPLPPVPQCQVLIAKPGINVSTRFVYTSLNADQLKPEQHPDIDGILAGIPQPGPLSDCRQTGQCTGDCHDSGISGHSVHQGCHAGIWSHWLPDERKRSHRVRTFHQSGSRTACL